MRRHTTRAAIAAVVLAVSAAGYPYASFAKWPSGPVSFFVNPANADLTPSAAVAALQYAMNVWTGAGSSFVYEYGGTVSDTTTAYDRRNVVMFRNVDNGSTIATTYSWWDSGQRLQDSDIVVWDARFTFFTGTSGCGAVSNSAYLEDIAVHEFGHALGLGHSSSSDASMYPSYGFCSQEFRSLASDDLAGVRALYPGGSTNTAPTVIISSPANGATFVEATSISLAATASDAQDGNLTSQIQWTDNSTAIGSGGALSRVLSVGVHTLVARVTDTGGLQGSAQVSITVVVLPTSGVNVAAAAQGASVTASSSYGTTGYPASAVINGDRRGANYGGGGVWHDATGSSYPDWVEIAFAGSRSIDRVAVFTVQDAWSAPSEPTAAMTWSQWGVNDFTVQYWTGAAWQTVPNGVVRNNNLVWRTVSFPALTTSRIRVLAERAADGWSRLTEVEAYQGSGAANTPPSVSLTSPAQGATAAALASFTVSANATDTEGPVASVAFYANGSLIGTDTTSPFSMSWTSVAAGTYTLTAVATDAGGLTTTSAPVTVTVTGGGATRINVAAAAQGATVTASSSYNSSTYPASAVINGDRRGANYGGGGVWHDASGGVYPDSVEIAFAGSRTIDEVAVFTVQNAWNAPSEPTPTMTWSQWGVNDFTVQYWTGTAWQTVPGGVVRDNTLVWRSIAFTPITTTRIRVLAERAADGWSRLTEVEALQAP